MLLQTKNIITATALSLVAATSFSQVKWPAITQQTKPWTRWWWLGSEVNKKDLTTVMQDYQKVGLGGLEVTPIYGVQGEESQYIKFLTPQWMDVFGHTLSEAKRLGLGIDLANATGWPFGGPWIGDADASKYMAYKTYNVAGGASLAEKVEFIQEPIIRTANYKTLKIEDVKDPVSANPDLQALSLDQVRFAKPIPLQVLMAYPEDGPGIDLTGKVDAAGKLNWTAPAGNWKLYGVFMGYHGKQVERAAPGGEGNVIDHFSASSLQHYLNRFDEAFKGKDLSALRGFFNDSYEVDDARGQSNYTPKLFEEFKARRGYDLKTMLPALLEKSRDDKSSRVLCDYRMTIDELILEKFTTEWSKWAKSKGKIVRNQSHGSPANTLDLYNVVDIPETEGTEILRIKFASSTSHVAGKQLTSSESATWLGEHFVSTLSDVKKALDVYFVGGVNHIFYHGTVYSPPSEPWPGRLFYAAVEFTEANPFWNNFGALNTYVARTQSFLQQGKADNDVLLYFPILDKYSLPERDLLQHFDGMKPEFSGTDFEKAAQTMQEEGYAFDYISDRQIQKLQSANGGILTGGVSYQTLVLPDSKFMMPATFEKLINLAKNGATIIAHNSLPSHVPGFGHLEENRAMLKSLLDQVQFGVVGKEGVRIAPVGKGRILIGSNLNILLAVAKVRKEEMVTQGMQFARRKLAAGTLYFIANRSDKKMEGWIPLAVKGSGASLYDPMYGKAGVARVRKDASGLAEVFMQLEPDQSMIVQTAAMPAKGTMFPYLNSSGTAMDIAGDWDLKFTEGGAVLPPALKQTELQPWTDMKDDAYQYFSGTASYSTHFQKPSEKSAQYVLDLGKVYESAQVILNGKKIATLIGPVYSVVINDKDLKASNQLEIRVSNSMANRIIDMDKKKIVWRKFNNTNMPARLGQNRGADGLFDASKWNPRPSGLAGPVTITAIK
ncbi:MAG: glycosyl hydrolase [Chitinophagaceae bacterium]